MAAVMNTFFIRPKTLRENPRYSDLVQQEQHYLSKALYFPGNDLRLLCQQPYFETHGKLVEVLALPAKLH